MCRLKPYAITEYDETLSWIYKRLLNVPFEVCADLLAEACTNYYLQFTASTANTSFSGLPGHNSPMQQNMQHQAPPENSGLNQQVS